MCPSPQKQTLKRDYANYSIGRAAIRISSFVSLSLDGSRLVLTIDEQAKADAALLDGCYVLETDVVVELMDARTIDERYRSLQQVEHDFRTLKTGFLEVRPVFVRKKLRTRAHVLIAMLALKIVRDAQEHLKTASVSNENERLSFQDAAKNHVPFVSTPLPPQGRRRIPPFTPTRQPPSSNLQYLGNTTSLPKTVFCRQAPN